MELEFFVDFLGDSVLNNMFVVLFGNMMNKGMKRIWNFMLGFVKVVDEENELCCVSLWLNIFFFCECEDWGNGID